LDFFTVVAIETLLQPLAGSTLALFLMAFEGWLSEAVVFPFLFFNLFTIP